MREVKQCYEKHKNEVISKIGEIDFTALSGHVCCLCEPDNYSDWDQKWDLIQYPMIPRTWKIKPINDSRKKTILKNLQQSIRKYDGVIVGTDSDMEGYGIYYLLETYLKIQDVFALRFIEHSLADADILKSLLSMTDYHKESIHKRFVESFILRSRSDWLFGMNMTRMMTVKQDSLLTIGRVKAPTIRLVYENSKAIENFQQREFYQLYADYGDFQAGMCDENGKLIDFDELSDLQEIHPPLTGIVKDQKVQDVRTSAPQLYDLSSLQIEAGQMLHMTPEEILEIVQSLYEKHKVISYPRTQCRYVSTEKAKEFPEMLSLMNVFPDLSEYRISAQDIKRVQSNKRVVNDVEVEKEAHDALLPTGKRPDLSKMTDKEIAVCRLIYMRLLAQFLPVKVEEKTKVILQHDDHLFVANGKRIKDLGWRKLYGDLKDRYIPVLKIGDRISAKRFCPVSKKTQPPKRLTQVTLLSAMEHIADYIKDKTLKESLADSKGIGTPATRHTVISDIIKRGYVIDRKGLYITKEGERYMKALEKFEISSPEFAAAMDYDIKRIQRGEIQFQDAWNTMIENLKSICNRIDISEVNKKTIKSRCPNCGELLSETNYYFVCDSCKNKIPRYVCGNQITSDMLESMLNGEELGPFKFKKKNGTTFSAKIKMDEKANLSFVSGFEAICPICGEKMRVNRGGCFCDCGLKVFRKICDVTLSEVQLKQLIRSGETDQISGFKKKNGDVFSAVLKIDPKNRLVKFVS